MSSTADPALQRLDGSTTAIWLVQCNPRRTDILATARTALPDAWCVKRYVSEIRLGDRVVLWLSGPDAGVYALGVITADAAIHPSGDTKASLDLFIDLFDRPIRRDVLKADPRFAEEPIIRQPFAANPHRLSPAAFGAILDQVARPS